MKKSLAFLFTVFLLLQFVPFSVEAEAKKGNITFQPNTIPDVNCYYQDYSFVFELKGYFIRIRPFVVFNGSYYGMNKIVSWIKRNYPNVNYKWLIQKATQSIHYGFNLTRLPRKVADRIDFLGFRLVDYNFPLSWFQTYEDEVWVDGLNYPITIIEIPKAHLQFSFADLYPYGYQLSHINSTYVLIGNVKGRTNLYMDPITFSVNTISISGFSQANPCSFWDVWNASNVNGWDVVHNNNESNMQYQFDANLAVSTYFNDTDVQVYFSEDVLDSRAIILNSGGILTLGQVDDATNHITSHGCSLISNQSTSGSKIVRAQSTGSKAYFYDCKFIYRGSTLGGYYNGRACESYTTTTYLWNCMLDGCGLRTSSAGTMDLYNVNVANSYIGLDSMKLTNADIIYVKDTYRGIQIYGANPTTLSNAIFRDASNVPFFVRAITTDKYLIDTDSDSWDFTFYLTSTAEVYRQYTFDASFFFSNNTYAEGANVTITNAYLGTSDSWILASNGSIPTQTYSMGHYNQTGGDTIYDYNPYNLTAFLDGYQTYTTLLNITRQEDLKITLLEETEAEEVSDRWILGVMYGIGGGFILAIAMIPILLTKRKENDETSF